MTDTFAYEMRGKTGETGFRQYPQLVFATVNDAGDKSGFSYLFASIMGNNRIWREIPMTALVITSGKISLTAPVVSDGQFISFVIPVGKDRAEMPAPLDSRVQLSPVLPASSRSAGVRDMPVRKGV
jgi:hypothetical protein